MNISNAVEFAVGRARRVKEEHVREVKGRKGETDIHTVVQGYRGEEPAVCVFTDPDRDMMLTVANIVAMGFGADTVALTFETFGVSGAIKEGNFEAARKSMINPDTGEEWGAGEMATYFEKHGPGLVDEALTTSVYNRAGDSGLVTLRYRIEDRQLKWVDEFNSLEQDGIGQPGGFVHDAITEIMGRPTAIQEMSKIAPEVIPSDYDRAQFHADMAGMKLFEMAAQHFEHERFAVMLCAKPGSLRHQLLRERYGRSQIMDPRDWN